MKKKVLIAISATLAYSYYMLNKYFPLNVKKTGDKKVIVCLGDSITFGAGVMENRKNDSYPAILGELVKDEYQVLNYGVSGATLLKEGDFPYKDFFWKRAFKQEPDIFILMLGTNDSKPYNWNKENYEMQFLERLAEIRGCANLKKIYVMVPPWATMIEGSERIMFNIEEDVIREQIRPFILSLKDKEDVEVIDLYEITKGHPEYFADGVHPNALGNRVLAEHIATYIKPNYE